jgi:hypothetical protein
MFLKVGNLTSMGLAFLFVFAWAKPVLSNEPISHEHDVAELSAIHYHRWALTFLSTSCFCFSGDLHSYFVILNRTT